MLSNTSSPEILTSHPIEAFASNETSENVLEVRSSGLIVYKGTNYCQHDQLKVADGIDI